MFKRRREKQRKMTDVDYKMQTESETNTVESGKNVTFFELIFCFYQLVLVV